ncbi:ribbon-helix-helix domain-containing protein [Endothiovibrio diazotrophicus]
MRIPGACQAMHFNIYVDDETGSALNQAVENSGKSRNAIIREAIREWLQHHGKRRWPEEVLAFEGDPRFPPFEERRDELPPPTDDPLA